METRRLTVLADPRRAQALLDSFVTDAAKLPADVRRQSDLARLPLAFQDRVEQAESNGLVWSAWTHGPETWLFIGQLNLHRARERGQPVLEIDWFDYERRTKKRTVALKSPTGAWEILRD